ICSVGRGVGFLTCAEVADRFDLPPPRVATREVPLLLSRLLPCGQSRRNPDFDLGGSVMKRRLSRSATRQRAAKSLGSPLSCYSKSIQRNSPPSPALHLVSFTLSMSAGRHETSPMSSSASTMLSRISGSSSFAAATSFGTASAAPFPIHDRTAIAPERCHELL